MIIDNIKEVMNNSIFTNSEIGKTAANKAVLSRRLENRQTHTQAR
jgi:hypothetical protein